jgi:hypothetical protein
MKVYASIKLHLAYHVDSTTLADGDYSEDPGILIADFSEAPNQGSEDINLTNPNPTSEGKPRT